MSSLLDWLIEHESSFRKTRLPSLYSDLLLQKTTNPDGYAANVTAWQAALTRAALAGQLPPSNSRFTLNTSNELLDALSSPQYGRPSGLGSVFDEAVRDGKMIDLKDFKAAERSIYARNWVPSPWSVLQWSLRQIGIGASSYDANGRLKAGSLVLVQALEEVSKQVMTKQQARGQRTTDRVISRDTFVRDFAQVNNLTLSEDDTSVLLQFLSRDKGVLSYDDKTVKFKAPNSTVPEPITEEDATIASITSLIKSIGDQVEALHNKVARSQANAQSSVKAGNKSSALSALRSKKLAERALQQRAATLHQLEDVFNQIEQASDQVEIVRVMEASAGVLKGLNQKVGGIERVDHVMEQLREEMEKVDEVGKVTAEPLTAEAVLDEGEIDDELEALEAEQNNIRAEADAKLRSEQAEKESEATRKRLEVIEGPDTPIEVQVERSAKRLSEIGIEDSDVRTVSTGSQIAET